MEMMVSQSLNLYLLGPSSSGWIVGIVAMGRLAQGAPGFGEWSCRASSSDSGNWEMEQKFNLMKTC